MKSHDKPIDWWQAKAAAIPDGACPKCGGLTQAYFAVDTSGDGEYRAVYRSVVEKCRVGGWGHTHLYQAGSSPARVNTTNRAVRPVGMNLSQDMISDDEADKLEARLTKKGFFTKKVVRLPGQPLKSRTIEDHARNGGTKGKRKT